MRHRSPFGICTTHLQLVRPIISSELLLSPQRRPNPLGPLSRPGPDELIRTARPSVSGDSPSPGRLTPARAELPDLSAVTSLHPLL